MKIFTFFYNRYDSATTSLALQSAGLKHTVLVHSTEDADKFRKHGTAVGEIVVTGNPKGLAYQRNSALELMNLDEWAAFLCDDLWRIRGFPLEWLSSSTQKIPVDLKNQNAFSAHKMQDYTLADCFELAPKLIHLAEQNKICLVGFKLHTNPQGVRNKFTTRGLADGRFWFVKKKTYTFDLSAQLADDVCWTAENLVQHGNVLVYNWLIPEFKRYTAGGFGTVPERIELRKKECAYIAAKYDPLVRIVPKPNWPTGTHIALFGSNGNIAKARARLGLPPRF